MTLQIRTGIDAGDCRTNEHILFPMTAFDDKQLPLIKTALNDKPLPVPKHLEDPGLNGSPLPPLTDGQRTYTGDPNDETAPKPSRRLKGETPRTSLFNLFSRPKVEKLRGYAEPGMSLMPIDESTTNVHPRMQNPEAILHKQNPDKPYSSRSGTNLSLRPSKERRGSSGSNTPGRLRRRSSNWVPPPLFQAYAQSIKVSKAQSTDGAGLPQTPRRRRDSHEVTVKKVEKPYRNASLTSIQYTGLPRQIFILTPSGQCCNTPTKVPRRDYRRKCYSSPRSLRFSFVMLFLASHMPCKLPRTPKPRMPR